MPTPETSDGASALTSAVATVGKPSALRISAKYDPKGSTVFLLSVTRSNGTGAPAACTPPGEIDSDTSESTARRGTRAAASLDDGSSTVRVMRDLSCSTMRTHMQFILMISLE